MRLALNQITTQRWSVREAAEGCARAGIGALGLWRDKVAEAGGAAAAARAVRDAGLEVSSLCRGGFFTAPGAVDDNRRAIEEAATLGTDLLVLVCGGLPEGSRDLPAARAMVHDGIAAVLDDAVAAGVRLGIEPLHPMFCADRSVITTLGEANDLAARFPEQVGVVVDAYHVWWDPRVYAEIARARILAFHIDDWVLPLPEGALLGRGLPGEGRADLPALYRAVTAAGYAGPVEVEVLSERVWAMDYDGLLESLLSAGEALERAASPSVMAASAMMPTATTAASESTTAGRPDHSRMP
jgi:sugar phosphate isomerase/epimerase